MPTVRLTMDQVVEIVAKMSPAERAEILRRIEGDPPSPPRAEILADLEKVRALTAKDVTSWAEAVIQDREDRF